MKILKNSAKYIKILKWTGFENKLSVQHCYILWCEIMHWILMAVQYAPINLPSNIIHVISKRSAVYTLWWAESLA